MERNSEQFYREFHNIVDGQFEPSLDRVSAFAADPEVVEIIEQIPMDKDALSTYYNEFVQLETIAIGRYGLSSQDVFKLIVDYWQAKQLPDSSEGTIE